MRKTAASVSVWNRSGMYQTFIKSGLWLSLAILSIWSCNKQSVPDINTETSSLGYVLAHGTNTTIFNSAVVKAGLDSLFSGPSIFTLFVPNDQACTQSGYPQSVIDGFSSVLRRDNGCFIRPMQVLHLPWNLLSAKQIKAL